jgi:hypothetical protein
VTPVATGAEIERARMLVRDVVAAENVIDYAARWCGRPGPPAAMVRRRPISLPSG